MNATEAFLRTEGKDLHKRRFDEPAKFLPVAFVTFVMGVLWFVYTRLHCGPYLLKAHYSLRTCAEVVVFNFSAIMMVACYLKCILTHPGTIPDKDWDYIVTVQDTGVLLAPSGEGLNMHEVKRSGNRRNCKWCSKFKPDRCHHCRVCRMCILKMDHHCPWIYNCVGFRNHKYFFLFVFYAALCTHIMMWTMMESVWRASDPDTPFYKMFLLVFGETLASVICAFITVFLGFHIWLMMKGLTTIEFCEKSKQPGVRSSPYNFGFLGNIRAVLGDNPLLWLCPCSLPSGDGLSFSSEVTPLRPSTPRSSRPSTPRSSR